MNNNILCLSIGLCLCASVYPAMAQKAGAATTPTAKATGIQVKDYKSFKEYVAKEDASLNIKPESTDNGPVKDVLKKLGIEFTLGTEWARSKDKKRVAVLSPDKKGAAVIDSTTRSVNIFNPKGKIVRKIPFPDKLVGRVGFSDTRLFDFKELLYDSRGGFFVYGPSGQLVKQVDDSGIVDAFMVSHNQKYLAVTSTLPGATGFFILYDMEGGEIWRQNTVVGSNPVIQFSRDDKFVLVKMQSYWLSHRGESKERKLYVFSVTDGKLVSEEHYAD